MEVALTPDTYMPIVDDNGKYADKIPMNKNGLYCPCGARRDKVYQPSQFRSHIKSKTHQKWLQTLNNNKNNHYVELLETKEIVNQQRKMLADMETKLSAKCLTIDMLTQQLALLNRKNVPTEDLLSL
jgi:hypothetical protein